MTPDRELLRQYAEEGDEDAFTEFVRRQADLVYSAALRVAGDAGLAQDVTQAVFTKLARLAGRLRRHDTIVGWLHTTARHEAINALRGEIRRRRREQEAFAMQNDSSAPEPAWEQLRPVLDEAVGALREDDRKAVLLRFFKNLSHQEVGAVLGLSEDTARKRVERALEKLRAHFLRQGVTVSSALLATAMSAHSVQAAPAGLSAKVAGCTLASAGTGGPLLAAISMSTKFKLSLFALAMLVLVAGLAINLRPSTQGMAFQTFALPPDHAPAVSSGHIPQAIAPVASPPPVPVAPMAASPAAETSTAEKFVAEPKTDLNSAISTGIHFLEAGDLASTLATLDTPGQLEQIRQLGYGQSIEEMAAEMRRRQPEMDRLLADQLAVFRAIQGQAPEFSPDGKRAIYRLNPPVNGHATAPFLKVGGFWYYGSGTEADWNAPP